MARLLLPGSVHGYNVQSEKGAMTAGNKKNIPRVYSSYKQSLDVELGVEGVGRRIKG